MRRHVAAATSSTTAAATPRERCASLHAGQLCLTSPTNGRLGTETRCACTGTKLHRIGSVPSATPGSVPAVALPVRPRVARGAIPDPDVAEAPLDLGGRVGPPVGADAGHPGRRQCLGYPEGAGSAVARGRSGTCSPAATGVEADPLLLVQARLSRDGVRDLKRRAGDVRATGFGAAQPSSPALQVPRRRCVRPPLARSIAAAGICSDATPPARPSVCIVAIDAAVPALSLVAMFSCS